jgi:hypothetical protein
MNKFALHNKDLVKMLMFISKIFNTKYKVVFLPIFSYISGNNNKERLVILVNYIVFELLVIFIKDLLKTDRPCLGQSGCPNYYDIPSGHSFGGIYFYLLLKNREYDENDNEFLKLSRKILLPILGLQPIFRYLSNVHSLEAVVSGAFIGYIAFKSKHYLDRII